MKSARVVLLLLLFFALRAQAWDNLLPPDAAEALKSGTKLSLFSIFPHGFYASLPYPKLKPEESFHGFKILGKIETVELEQRTAVSSVIDAAVRGFDGSVAGCFEPQHGVRVQSGEDIFDFVICFHCSHIFLYHGDEFVRTIPITGSSEAFDKILKAANVPLPEREPPTRPGTPKPKAKGRK